MDCEEKHDRAWEGENTLWGYVIELESCLMRFMPCFHERTISVRKTLPSLCMRLVEESERRLSIYLQFMSGTLVKCRVNCVVLSLLALQVFGIVPASFNLRMR